MNVAGELDCRTGAFLKIVLLSFTIFAFIALLNEIADAQTYSVLYEFTGGADGSDPNDVTRDSAGNLYGTTVGGGTTVYGTVFKLDTSGKKTILHNFLGGSDGNAPYGKLVRDSAGNLYGTTEFGGNTSVMCEGSPGCGTVFKISPTGKETILYKFTGGTDGGMPLAGLWRDSSGNLYGTTSGGGNIGCNYIAIGCGVVFKVTPTGKESVLYAFAGPNDGGYSGSPVIRDSAGNLYGMTSGYGTNTFGTIFKISPSGKESVLHAFNGTDGAQPWGALIRDSKGTLYGTTYNGGITSDCGGDGCGIVFKLSLTGKLTVLHSFTGGSDGSRPIAGLVEDSKGNLYGTAAVGGLGPNCCGVLYEITQDDQELELYTFTGLNDGGSPVSGLTMDSAGNLYGSALLGTYGYGVIFKLTP